jgi:hypothetical protein
MFKFKEMLRSISLVNVSMRNSLLQLMILPTGNELLYFPKIGWNLCCCPAISSAHPSLTLCQGFCFEIPKEQRLQADYRQLKGLNVMYA